MTVVLLLVLLSLQVVSVSAALVTLPRGQSSSLFVATTTKSCPKSRGLPTTTSLATHCRVQGRLPTVLPLSSTASEEEGAEQVIDSESETSPTTTKMSKAAATRMAKDTASTALKKAELIAAVADEMKCSKKDAEIALEAILRVMQQQVNRGQKVSWSGFGSFQLKSRAARMGRNPMTGEEIPIAASKYPAFTVAKGWKDMLKQPSIKAAAAEAAPTDESSPERID